MIFLFAEIPWKSKTDPCEPPSDRKSTRLNSSHDQISYAVFCLKKKNKSLDYSHDMMSYVLMFIKKSSREGNRRRRRHIATHIGTQVRLGMTSTTRTRLRTLISG